jgi:transcriptional regulator with XRE-family HTH domain
MTARVRNAGVAVAGAALLASGAYALGSQAGNGSAAASGGVARSAAPVNYGYGPPGRPRFGARRFQERGGFGLDALAGRLGVTPAQLRSALQDIRKDLPSRDDLAAKLAGALGVPVDKVSSALAHARPDRGMHRRFAGGPAAALAKALGLDEAKVRAAFEKLRSQFRPGAGRTDFEAALAQELGVSTDKLDSALNSLRPPGPPPGAPHDRGAPDALAKALGVTPSKLQAAFDKIRTDERNAFVDALAKRLDLDPSKVSDAIGREGPFGHRHP